MRRGSGLAGRLLRKQLGIACHRQELDDGVIEPVLPLQLGDQPAGAPEPEEDVRALLLLADLVRQLLLAPILGFQDLAAALFEDPRTFPMAFPISSSVRDVLRMTIVSYTVMNLLLPALVPSTRRRAQ